MEPLPDWPAQDEEKQLLAALRSGTPTAKEEIAARYHRLLVAHLERTCRWAAEELCNDAADRALLDFLLAPGRYDPARARLGAYLRLAAKGDLLNLWDQERRARRGIPLDSVAEPADRRNNKRDEELTFDHPRLAAEVAAFDAEERAAFELMLEGARDTAAFARTFDLGHLPEAEQALKVKRVKDRVKKRLARAAEDLR
jgi:hypothetical protein